MLHALSPQVIHSGAAAHRVPFEILEVIAGEVDDAASLSSCSLVCRFFSAAVRRHRFRVVEISLERPRDNQRFTLISLLCDPTSTVLPLVREIQFKDEKRDYNDSGLSEGSRCSLMQLCQRITYLSLHVDSAAKGISSADLIQLLLVGKSLRTVRITNSGMTGGWPREPSEPYDRLDFARAISPIASINLAGCLHAYLPALLGTFFFPHLTEVILEDITRRDLDDVMPLLRACSSTVDHLRLMFGALLMGLQTPCFRRREIWNNIAVFFVSQGGLSNLTALRSIHLAADLPHVPAFLQPLMHVKHLEELTIKASPHMLRNCDKDALACSVSTLAHAAVRLRVSFLCEYDSDRRDLLRDPHLLYWMRNTPLDKLSELQGSGRLRFLRIIMDRDTGRKIAIEDF